MDAATIANLCTAGGTLVLAAATFASVRSANASARVAERALRLNNRPTLMPTRPQDGPVKVDFAEELFKVEAGQGMVEDVDGQLLFAMGVRNVGSGLAVLRGWHVEPDRVRLDRPSVDLDDFRMLTRDLYVSPNDVGFWQGGMRDRDDPQQPDIRKVLAERGYLTVEVLYEDQEGHQRFVSRFAFRPREVDGEPRWWVSVSRHFAFEA